ncbi:MAG: hypothetical protein V1695_02185 [Candidatus Uhrbacteria bacterium]
MIKNIVAIMIGLALCLSIAAPVMAQNEITATELLQISETDTRTIGDVAGLGTEDLSAVIAQIIRAILGFLGVVAVVIIIWGGFLWMTSGGETEKVGKARKFIIMGIVGLAIVFSAYAIASFVITALVGAVTA